MTLALTARIWIDADACPRDVKELVFRAGERTQLPVMVVANKTMFVPNSPLVRMIQVAGGPDVADDHIVRESWPLDLTITADVPLAARLVAKRVVVLNPRGEEYDAENIGERLSVRDFLTEARDLGITTGGPAAYGPKDKQRFANALDRALHRVTSKRRAASIIVAGVSGVGKSTIGAALAKRLSLPYADGDTFHTPESMAKMRASQPLDDTERAPWLERIAAWLYTQQPGGAVVACSALRRVHRERLREAAQRITFVQLTADASLLAARLEARTDHFMPASLLASQLATSEPLSKDENGVVIDTGTGSVEELVERVLTATQSL